MMRESANQKSFEKTLYAMEPNFPSGKLPGMPQFTDLYVNPSQGEGGPMGSWNAKKQMLAAMIKNQAAISVVIASP